MKQFKPESKPEVGSKIETIKGLNNNEVSFSPDRGGIITSLKLDGKEVLYMDESTFNNKEKNVKGGIPILFPNAGPISEDLRTKELTDLKQHGFARNEKWVFEKTENGFKMSLFSNEATKEVFPYDFEVHLDCQFEEDNSFTIKQIIKNIGREDMPVSCGLHPYFKVLNNKKKEIKFNFEGGNKIEEKVEDWSNGKSVSVKNTDSKVNIEIPELGELSLSIDQKYERIWVWSMVGKDFVCIEPVMRDKNGIILNPERVKPGENLELTFNISFKSSSLR